MRITPWLYLAGSRQFGLSSPYDCHIYALRGTQGLLLIDAGSGLETGRVVENLRLEAGGEALSRGGTILVTHKHPDHAAGAASLSQALGGWPVWTSEFTRATLESGDEVESGLRDARFAGGYPASMSYPPCPVARTFGDGEEIEAEGFRFRAIHVRGHSADSMAFYLEHAGMRCLFSVDIVFYGGIIGLIASSDSSLAGYRQDIGKLSGLQIDALLPSHGLFTLRDGQQHIDLAVAELRKGFVPRCIGQGDRIF